MIDLLYIVSQKIKMYMGMGIGKFIFIEKKYFSGHKSPRKHKFALHIALGVDFVS